MYRTAITAMITIGAVVAVAAGAASAHASLERSNPADGQVLSAVPDRARLTFDEAIAATGSTARLVDHEGRAVRTRAAYVTANGLELDLPLPSSLARGSYGVLWRALAEDDGHETNGAVIFSIGAPDATTDFPAGSSSSHRALDVARRWAGLVPLVVLAGALALLLLLGRPDSTEQVAGPSGSRARLRRSLLSVGVIAAAGGAVLGLADLAAEAARARAGGQTTLGAALAVLTSTRWGAVWLVREAALAALVAVLLALRTFGRSRARVLSAAAGLLIAARFVAEALAGHASAASPRLFAVGVDALHVASACVWVGSVACAVVLVPAVVRSQDRAALLRGYRVRFSQLMAGSFVIAVATGLYTAGVQLPTVGAVTGTGYGRALLIKLGILALVGAVAARNALRLHRGRPLGKGVVIEAGLAAVVLLVVAVLIETPPGRGSEAARTTGLTATTGVADLVVDASLTPGVPGTNGLTVVVASTRRPAPAPVTAVTGRSARQTFTLRRTGPDRYFGTVDLTAGARARAMLVIVRGSQRLTVPVSWPTARASTGMSLRTLSELASIAVLLLGGAAVFAGRRVLRREAARPEPEPDLARSQPR